MDELNNQTFLPKFDKWVFYFNTRNYETMPNPVRDALQEMFKNRNNIHFDNTNKLHGIWDD